MELESHWDPVNDWTEIRFYGDTMAPLERLLFCMWLSAPWKKLEILRAEWTIDGTPTGDLIPVVSIQVAGTEPLERDLTFANLGEAAELLVVETIDIGPSEAIRPLEDLTWDGVEDVVWEQSGPDIWLGPDDTYPFNNLTMPADGAIVYRVRMYYDSDPANVVEYVGQYTLTAPFPIPASSSWGLIVMTLLGLTAGVVTFRCRRAPAA